MILEYRHKDGTLFTKVSGRLALDHYELFTKSEYFKKETKTFIDNGSFTCLVCLDIVKLTLISEFEILFGSGDYIKIIP